KSYTLGFDYRPSQVPGFFVRGTYYKIDYKDRIAQAATVGSVFADPTKFPDALYRGTSAALIEQLLTSTRNTFNTTTVNLSDPHAAALSLAADPNFWIRDFRYRNLSLSNQDGIDLAIGDHFTTTWGEVRLGTQLTWILDYKQQNSPNTAVLSVLDTVRSPVG